MLPAARLENETSFQMKYHVWWWIPGPCAHVSFPWVNQWRLHETVLLESNKTKSGKQAFSPMITLCKQHLMSGHYHSTNLHWRCKLKGDYWRLILIQTVISIKMPVQYEAHRAHLSVAPFANLLDHHAAVEWEGILKRSRYLKFKALWAEWEAIYSATAGRFAFY